MQMETRTHSVLLEKHTVNHIQTAGVLYELSESFLLEKHCSLPCLVLKNDLNIENVILKKQVSDLTRQICPECCITDK